MCCVAHLRRLATLQHPHLKGMPRTRIQVHKIDDKIKEMRFIIWCSFGKPQKLALDYDIQT